MKLNYLLFCFLSVLLYGSCKESKEPIPEPGGNMVDMINALDQVGELSTFTDLLKGIYSGPEWAEEEFTLFAFKIHSARATDNSPARDLLQRHMVKGKWSLSDFKEKEELTTVNNRILTVETIGEDIYINGEKLGTAVVTSGAVAYPIDQSLPEIYAPEKDIISFRVLLFNDNYKEDPSWDYMPAANVEIVFFTDNMYPLERIVTDADGVAILTNINSSYGGFKVYGEEGNSNLWNDYLVSGLITDPAEQDAPPCYSESLYPKKVGSPRLVDINGDNIVNKEDKVQYQPLDRRKEEITVYIGTYVPETPLLVETKNQLLSHLYSFMEDWETLFQTYAEFNRIFATEEQRRQIQTSDSRILAFYNDAYTIINQVNGVLADGIIKKEVYDENYDVIMQISSFRAFAYYYLTVFFGGVPLIIDPAMQNSSVSRNSIEEVKDFITSMGTDALAHIHVSQHRFLTGWAAIYFYFEKYEMADRFYTKDLIRLYDDVDLLNLAEINLRLGRLDKAKEYLDIVAFSYGEFYNGELNDKEMLEYIQYQYTICHPTLCRNPLYFINAVRWGETDQWDPYLLLLPIPLQAMMVNPNLTQNPGW